MKYESWQFEEMLAVAKDTSILIAILKGCFGDHIEINRLDGHVWEEAV